MRFEKLLPKQSLNKAYLKEKLSRSAIEHFKQNFTVFLGNTSTNQGDEEHLKSQVAYFLRDTWYKESHHINPIGKNDLVIHTGKTTADPVGVIIEVKSLTNKAEMIGLEKPNAKALHELVLYYLRQRIYANNNEIKYLVATNIDEWFIFDANEFDRKIFRNTAIKRLYELKKSDGKDNPWFYDELKKLLAQQADLVLEPTHFNLRDFEQVVQNTDSKDDNKLIGIYKILSPVHLLKLPFANDSNSLQPKFYAELLHLIGLTEVKEGSKKLIQRRKDGERNSGSLLESAINTLDTHDKISRLPRPSQYGDTQQERLFNVALELVITWVNRILFLKLLEAQLASYHKGDKSYRFLNKEKIQDFDDLDKLFFSVLARKPEDRREDINKLFGKVPYLNSSLFEPTDLEHNTTFISGLEDRVPLPVLSSSVLKSQDGKALKGSLNTIDYLFAFLDAYDFSSEGSEEIQEDNKTLINASVLGLIFEKINGYKDGSFFTPGFITMYMCRETIRRAVAQKFNDAKGWDCKEYGELYDKINDTKEANQIINSLKICDPAVGSGHFLVSALNEIIAIKSDLRILLDREGRRLKEYQLEVVNDELIVTDDDAQLLDYNPKSKESQRVQEALFHEKQTIIESCLFGVDINPNSVKICRLRLWIELLKNAYYNDKGQLETLPNIDINIKTGNSLISRFALDSDLKQALKKSRFGIDAYKIAVQTYRSAKDKEEKREMERLIASIKSDFRSEMGKNDPKLIKLNRLSGELYNLTNQKELFGESKAQAKLRKEKTEKLEKEITLLSAEIDEIKSNKIYENAFEWRFEFPEVLNDEGDFVGFDVVIGNPPYIPSRGLVIGDLRYYTSRYLTNTYQVNTYALFCELGLSLLSWNGIQCFIIPNYWLATDNDRMLRNLLFQKYKTTDIINVYNVFESATVDTLLLFTKKTGVNEHSIINIKSISRDLDNIQSRLDGFKGQFWSYDKQLYLLSLTDSVRVSFENKIQISAAFRIEDFFDLKFGVKLYQVGKGKPPQTKIESAKKLYESKTKVDDTYIKLLRARNIQRYFIRDEEHFIKYGDHLAEPRSLSLFHGERILVQRIVSRAYLDAAFSNELLVCNTDVITLKPRFLDVNVKFFLGILTSRLCSAVIKSENVNLDRNAFPKINTRTLASFPVPRFNSDGEALVDLVDKMISLKGENNGADASFLQTQIDQLVYQLYSLTEEQIKIVEGETISPPNASS